METLDDFKARHQGTVVFVSRAAGLRLGPLGVVFAGPVVDEDAERAARERISAIDRRLGKLRAGALEDREQTAEETRRLMNERAGCVSRLGQELCVAAIPKAGPVTLGPGNTAEAPAVLDFLRAHRLHEAEPADGGTFWELAA